MKTWTMILSTFFVTTVGIFAAAPPVPTLSTPAQNATSVPVTTSLTWAASAGATSYHVQLSTDSTFATTVINDPAVTGTTESIALLANGTAYYWRVNATDGTDTSAYSTTGKFTTVVAAPPAPTLTAPANNATNVAVSTNLTWRTAARATSYSVQLSTDSTFATTLVNSALSDTTFAVGPLANGTIYYWRVNATNTTGTSAYSTRRRFTTIVAIPPAPTLTAPAQNATGVLVSTSLTWEASTGATTYRVQVSTDAGFATTVVNDSTPTATTLAVGPLANNTVYYWRVNAKNAGGTSAYSTVQSFTTVVTAPTLISPAQNTTIYSISTNLTWSAVPGATSYRVQVSYNAAFTNIVLNDSTLTTTSRALTNLNYGSVYYWRVNAKNAGGTGAYSATGQFTVAVVGILPNEFALRRLNLGNDENLSFRLPQKEHVVIRLFNSEGRMVSQLLNETRPAGDYTVSLSNQAKGSYYLDFAAGNFHRTMPVQP